MWNPVSLLNGGKWKNGSHHLYLSQTLGSKEILHMQSHCLNIVQFFFHLGRHIFWKRQCIFFELKHKSWSRNINNSRKTPPNQMYIFLKPLSVISMCYIYPRCSCPNQKRWKVGDVIKNKKEVSISYELKAWRALEWILRQKYNLDDKKPSDFICCQYQKRWLCCVIEQNLITQRYPVALSKNSCNAMDFVRRQEILSIRIPPVLQAPHTAWLFFSVYEFVFLCEQWAL